MKALIHYLCFTFPFIYALAIHTCALYKLQFNQPLFPLKLNTHNPSLCNSNLGHWVIYMNDRFRLIGKRKTCERHSFFSRLCGFVQKSRKWSWLQDKYIGPQINFKKNTVFEIKLSWRRIANICTGKKPVIW